MFAYVVQKLVDKVKGPETETLVFAELVHSTNALVFAQVIQKGGLEGDIGAVLPRQDLSQQYNRRILGDHRFVAPFLPCRRGYKRPFQGLPGVRFVNLAVFPSWSINRD